MNRQTLRIAASLFWLAGLAMPAFPQVDQGRALAAIEACRELSSAVARAEISGPVPRLDDPQFSAIFARALDASIAETGGLQAPGLALLLDMQQEAGALLRAYLLKDIKADALASDLSGAHAARNFLAFLPELAALYDFRVAIGSALSQSAAALATGTPDPAVSEALAAMSSEQEKVLLSAIAAASDQQIDAQWRVKRVEMLNRSVSGFTALMGRKKAQEIADRALAAAIAEQSPQVASQLKDFALALLR